MNHGNKWDAIHPREPGRAVVTGARALPPMPAGRGAFAAHHCHLLRRAESAASAGHGTARHPAKPPSLPPRFPFTLPTPTLTWLGLPLSLEDGWDLLSNAWPGPVPWAQPERELRREHRELQPEAALAKGHARCPAPSSSDRRKSLDQVPGTKLQMLSGDVLWPEVICTLRIQTTRPKNLGVTMVFSDREVSTSFYRNPPYKCGSNICFWKWLHTHIMYAKGAYASWIQM